MSCASSLTSDHWTANTLSEEHWDSVTPESVEAAIRRLNQRERTQVTIDGKDGWFMMVGGGDGAYVVSIENRMTGEAYDLLNEACPADQRVEVVTGGQRGVFEARLVVDLTATLAATQRFAVDGQPEPTLTWLRTQRA